HDTSVLTRPDRAVQSLDALKQQIAGCAHMANKQFSGAEARDLLKYLNDQFYHVGRRGGWWGARWRTSRLDSARCAGPKFCSMAITRAVRDHAAKLAEADGRVWMR